MTDENMTIFDDYEIPDEAREAPETEAALITVTSLPEIEENLRALRERWQQKAADAAAMICTEETVQAVKSMRADMRREFDEAEAQRKAAKAAYMAPWDAVEATYKECVSDAFKAADGALKGKISALETELKDACKAELSVYFDELCAANGVDFLTLDTALNIGGMKIGLADAKSASQKKLKKGLAVVVETVVKNIEQINAMEPEDVAAIMAEYKTRFDVGDAVATVQARKRRIEAEREAAEARKAAQEARSAAAAKVDAVLPPKTENADFEAVQAAERRFRITFTVNVTREQGIKLREFMKQEGISYE